MTDARTRQPSRTAWIVAIALIALAGALLRLPGIFTDFWLDEVWSFLIARNLHSLPDLLFSEIARIDNNHLLNTFFLYAIGDVSGWWVYRIPSLLAGIGSIVAAAHVMSRFGRAESIFAAILVAFSFLFVFYSSEARGYAMAAFFAIVAFDALLEDLDRPRAWTAGAFVAACILGFLSHLTFVHFYIAAMFWSVLKIRRQTNSIPAQLARWLRLNLVPIAFCGALYYGFIRHLIIGGAAPTRPMQIIAASLSLAAGGPDRGAVSYVVAAIATACFLATLGALLLRRNDAWLFYLLAVVVAPLFLLMYDLLLSERPQPLMPRYFLVALTFVLLALSQGAAMVWRDGAGRRWGPPARVMLAAAGLAFAAGSLVQWAPFYALGRGHYMAALQRMLSESGSAVVTVASDNEFPVSQIIEFYRPRVIRPEDAAAGRAIDMYRESAPRRQPPQWVIVTRPSDTARPARRMTHGSGAVYEWDSTYESGPLSGTRWCLYRLDVASSNERMRRR